LRPSLRSLAPNAWLRLPARTARMRLTLLYAGLFLMLGTGLLTATYLATGQSSTIHIRVGSSSSGARVVKATPAPASAPGVAEGPTSQDKISVVDQHNADLDRLLAVSWVVLGITTVGAAILGWFAAGRVLRPLRKITSTARTISVGNLHERLALTGPDDEFRQLGDTLDDLFGRLESSFEAQRRFVANASHELRTPLTLERTLLQVALADPDGNEATLRATCEELLISQADHARLLEGLLTLASSERGLEHRESVELSALTGHMLAHLPPEARRLGLSIEASLDPAVTSGDRALIQRLIANLIDNAVDHNITGGRVEIQTGSDGGQSEITVANTGPNVPTSEIDRLFEPFQRLAPDRTNDNGHHGLGLSIVRAIASAHEATIAARPGPEGGLIVTVCFPVPTRSPGADAGPESGRSNPTAS
jgi:signal transduction histidine kinase